MMTILYWKKKVTKMKFKMKFFSFSIGLHFSSDLQKIWCFSLFSSSSLCFIHIWIINCSLKCPSKSVLLIINDWPRPSNVWICRCGICSPLLSFGNKTYSRSTVAKEKKNSKNLLLSIDAKKKNTYSIVEGHNRCLNRGNLTELCQQYLQFDMFLHMYWH